MNEFNTIGIDVSKKFLDIHFHPENRSLRINNTKTEINKFCKDILKIDNLKQVIFEPSGGYERLLVTAFISFDVPFTLVNPKKARDFAKSAGLLAKTDKIDAYALALFAYKFDFRQSFIKSTNQIKLAELMQRRRQLVDMKTQEMCRKEKALSSEIQKNITKIIAYLENELRILEHGIEILIKEDPYFKKIFDLLIKIKGVGKHTIETLLANLPELGQIGNKQIASLCGLAPFAKDSGTLRGQRHIIGGRSSVRKVLYLAVTAAIHYDKKTKEYFEAMKLRGKPSKVAMTALMRKLIVIMNAKVRDLLNIIT